MPFFCRSNVDTTNPNKSVSMVPMPIKLGSSHLLTVRCGKATPEETETTETEGTVEAGYIAQTKTWWHPP